MWLRKLKTKTRNQPETPVVSSPTFSVSSFKDIESLYEEEDNNTTTTTTNNNSISSSNRNNKVPKLKFSNVFHRVRSATSLLRAFSNQKKGEGNVQEPVQTLQSLLHVSGKAKGVVSEKGGLEKKQFLIEEKEKTSIGEVGVQESIKDKGVVVEKGDLEKNGKDKGVVSEEGGLEKNQFLVEEKTSIGEVGVQEPINDKGIVLEKGDLEKKQFLIEEPTSIEKIDDNVQELIEPSKSLHHGDKDDGAVLEKVNLEKNQVLIEEPSSVGEVADVKVDDNVQESNETLKSLHHGDKGDGVVLEKVDLEKNQVLIEEPSSVGEVAYVKVDDNVQESVETLKSLHHGDKDDGVVLEKGDLEKNQVLIEEPSSVGEVAAVKVDDNVQESVETLKSLHHLDKDDGVVLEKGDLEKNQVSIEQPSSIGEVGDVKVDVNVDDKGARIELPGTETRVVIFFTSLRVVRSTFEDCKYARTILHSFPVSIDERDLFMDGRFMNELQRIMGIDEKTNLTLPRVFIGGRYIGGAEEIRRLHEAGELKNYLEGLAPAPGGTCETCGGHGFILCVECDGSHKCYEDKGGFKPCSGCNENGLVRCPSCSSAPL